MNKLRPTQGNWVTGDRFWGREYDIKRFKEILEGGAHIHLSAQRRIGKTSLMREVGRKLSHRYTCVYVDVEDAKSPEDFVAALGAATRAHQGLWAKTVDVFRNVLGTSADAIESLQLDEVVIKIREGLVGGSWKAKADRLIAALAESDKQVILFLDEVPILVNRMLGGLYEETTPEKRESTDIFLSWMRRVALRHQGRIRFVVTGSIGFGPILRSAGLSSTINHLHHFDLRPWDEETTLGALHALGNWCGLTWANDAAERVIELLGVCIPHHVQVFFGHVREVTERRHDTVCSIADVEKAYTTRMLGTRGHAELDTFEERLKLVVPHHALPFIFDLLTEAAVTGRLDTGTVGYYLRDHGFEGRDGDELGRHVLDVLDHDGYLHRTDDHYAFASHLLRDWWQAKHGSTFTPASDR